MDRVAVNGGLKLVMSSGAEIDLVENVITGELVLTVNGDMTLGSDQRGRDIVVVKPGLVDFWESGSYKRMERIVMMYFNLPSNFDRDKPCIRTRRDNLESVTDVTTHVYRSLEQRIKSFKPMEPGAVFQVIHSDRFNDTYIGTIFMEEAQL